MLSKKIPGNLCKALILLIILILGARGIYDTRKYSEILSPISGGGDERHVLSSVEGYYENGLFSSAGLPDFNFDGENPKLPSPYIYTHFPPGPYWIAFLYSKICSGNLGCMRLFPTALRIFSLLIFAWFLLSNLSPARSAVIMLMVAAIPFTSNSMHGLAWHVYALSLLIIQLGFLLTIFKKKKSLTMRYLLLLFLLGFLQGWISYDWFFVVSFSALPFALLYSSLDQKEDKERLVLAILSPLVGFAFAHFLHLIEVSVYYGSITTAMKDIFSAGLMRFGADSFEGNLIDGKAVITNWAGGIDRIILILKYLFIYAGLYLPVLLGTSLILIWFKNARLIIERPLQITLKWTSSRRNFYVILTAFLLSFGWVIIMYHHARHHPPFIVPHQILLYFIAILTALECLTTETSISHKA